MTDTTTRDELAEAAQAIADGMKARVLALVEKHTKKAGKASIEDVRDALIEDLEDLPDTDEDDSVERVSGLVRMGANAIVLLALDEVERGRDAVEEDLQFISPTGEIERAERETFGAEDLATD